MTKSELIDTLALHQPQLSYRDVEFAVNEILDKMTRTLATQGRIEIRGFGSFSLHYRAARTGRNPKTGEQVHVPGKYVPHFKPGKALREQVNQGKDQ
ncbi:MAG: integration host factor subunit beta [Gammaproteobacteria bacterium]|nr:MAG: integration host factor subunit beta [Gammaproteobacteria bacterium]